MKGCQGGIGVPGRPLLIVASRYWGGLPARASGVKGGPSPPARRKPWQEPQSCSSMYKSSACRGGVGTLAQHPDERLSRSQAAATPQQRSAPTLARSTPPARGRVDLSISLLQKSRPRRHGLARRRAVELFSFSAIGEGPPLKHFKTLSGYPAARGFDQAGRQAAARLHTSRKSSRISCISGTFPGSGKVDEGWLRLSDWVSILLVGPRLNLDPYQERPPVRPHRPAIQQWLFLEKPPTPARLNRPRGFGYSRTLGSRPETIPAHSPKP